MLRYISLLVIGLAPLCPALAQAQQTPRDAPAAEHRLLGPTELQWTAGPASLPAGAQVAMLEGNPTEAGPFTVRLRLPDGYRIPPHWHPGIEHVTVLSGTFVVGRGEEVVEAAMRELPQGGFMVMPPRSPHYVQARGETVLQLHGVGPWGITYVDPADDPRRQAP